MNSITKEEYRKILKQYDDIVKLIIAKTIELAFIQWGRAPIGECDITEFEEKDGELIVYFESYSCGESDYDTFHLPLEFLFDENYPEKYKVIFKEEQRKKKEEKIEKEREKRRKEEERIESYDKREYKRLKVKYENER